LRNIYIYIYIYIIISLNYLNTKQNTYIKNKNKNNFLIILYTIFSIFVQILFLKYSLNLILIIVRNAEMWLRSSEAYMNSISYSKEWMIFKVKNVHINNAFLSSFFFFFFFFKVFLSSLISLKMDPAPTH
jgi:hypothetical protein